MSNDRTSDVVAPAPEKTLLEELGITFEAVSLTRAGQAIKALLYNDIVDGLGKDYRVRQLDVEGYCWLVVGCKFVEGLKTAQGLSYEVPSEEATIQVHIKAFKKYMETNEQITDEIIEAAKRKSNPFIARHNLPDSQLTPAEVVDPN